MSALSTQSASQLALLRDTVAKDLTEQQFQLFAAICQQTGLNPLRREIYAMKRGGQMSIICGIDGLRKMAQATGEYRGQQVPVYCGPSGEWTEVWTDSKPPVAAKVTVIKKDGTAVSAVALWVEFAQNSPTWKKMPTVMLSKVAESQALRKAFPAQLSAVYEQAEMEKPVDVFVAISRMEQCHSMDELLEVAKEYRDVKGDDRKRISAAYHKVREQLEEQE